MTSLKITYYKIPTPSYAAAKKKKNQLRTWANDVVFIVVLISLVNGQIPKIEPERKPFTHSKQKKKKTETLTEAAEKERNGVGRRRRKDRKPEKRYY